MYWDLYRDVADVAGVPRAVWNMHARHGGTTEAKETGVALDNIAEHAQHTDINTTPKHYIVPSVEASRRVAKQPVASPGEERMVEQRFSRRSASRRTTTRRRRGSHESSPRIWAYHEGRRYLSQSPALGTAGSVAFPSVRPPYCPTANPIELGACRTSPLCHPASPAMFGTRAPAQVKGYAEAYWRPPASGLCESAR
jgi:hypothetical protein